jgi:hypothetical protein
MSWAFKGISGKFLGFPASDSEIIEKGRCLNKCMQL